jgi:N-dimethylarginine dimethylaminohydrolase
MQNVRDYLFGIYTDPTLIDVMNFTSLIKQLERNGFDIMPVVMRHCRTLSGGPHCATLDTVRDDEYGDYS